MRILPAFVFCFLALTTVAFAQVGAALPSGYLSVNGNQFVDSTGKNVRISSMSYRGTPTDQATMNAIRQAGPNTIRIDWRDAYLASGGSGTTTFDDEFTSAPWLTHEAWQSGDMWSFAGTAFHTGVAQGPTWWANPNDTSAAASVYTDSGTSLNLSLIKNPTGSGISPTACDVGGVPGQPCPTIGALINNQNTPGGLVQLFGDYQFSVAVPSTPGFLFQWDIECQPATCSDGGMEYDVGIWTDSSSVQHVQFSNQCCSGNIIYFATTSVDITKQHVYEVNWQSANTTFYIDGVQQFQTPTPGGEFQTAGALSYFLTSDATYFGYASSGPSTANLPATASIDWYRVYQAKPTGTAPVGCNTLTQMDQCVALAAAATPQPLKVIFSHRGNEIPSSPSNACNARQANGLWFDSGGSSGNDDGCGDGGNVTYAKFKADTVALMQRYAGNSTVIGYDFHAEPLVNGAFTGQGGGGTFSINSSGQIIDPNGAVFIARGTAINYEDINGGLVPPSLINQLFPRMNMVRLANFVYGGYTDPTTPGTIASWINQVTALGIVVQLSDYQETGTCRSGQDLANGAAWYKKWAANFASNPYVWWATANECFAADGTAGNFQTQVITNYGAIRASAPTAMVGFEASGGNPTPGGFYTVPTIGNLVNTIPTWAPNTAYSSGTLVVISGRPGFSYSEDSTVGNCTSGSSAPSGTGQSIVDGSCLWNYGPTTIDKWTNMYFGVHNYSGNIAYPAAAPTTQALADAAVLSNTQAYHAQFTTNTEPIIPVIASEQGPNDPTTPHSVDFLATLTGLDETALDGSKLDGFDNWEWNCSCSGALFQEVNGTTITANIGAQEATMVASAPGTGPTPFTGGGPSTGGQAACTAFPTANSCGLTQAQLNTLAANAYSTMLSEVPGGECFNIACTPTDFLVGDTIITTATGSIPPTGTAPVPLTDKDGVVWSLLQGTTCQGVGPDWWWGGMAINGVQRWCGYISALRKMSNGHVFVEASKGGGWWDLTLWQENGGDSCTNDCGAPGEGGDPGAGINNFIGTTPGTGGTNPPVNWNGGGDTDIMAACNDVGAAVFTVNPGVIQFCEGPLNNGANNLLSGAAKP